MAGARRQKITATKEEVKEALAVLQDRINEAEERDDVRVFKALTLSMKVCKAIMGDGQYDLNFVGRLI